MSPYPSTQEIVEQHKYLWDGSDPGWVLVRVVVDDEPFFAIEHEPTNTGLIIEDDAAYSEIIQRMQEAGVRIIE
jgi:hypothetical protein